MRLVLIRHAIAEDREAFAASGQDDARRPLTKEGRWKMERNVHGLRRAIRAFDVLASSPLVRAAQTAKIVAEEYGGMDVTTAPSLAPDAPLESFLTWLRHQRQAETVAVVGHDPHLAMVGTWLLTGAREAHLELRKGGACLLEFAGPPKAGAAQLLWLLTPAVLRRLAD
jgi:phosphohistidine phosphatase